MPIRKLSRALGWTLLLGAAAPPPARVGPTYDSPDTRALVEAMVEAHGGLDVWRAARTVGLRHVLFWPEPPPGLSPWIVHASVVDLRTRTQTHRHPLASARVSAPGGVLIGDGWQGLEAPAVLAEWAFEAAFLPWLTQDQGVTLRDRGEGALADWDGALKLVELDRGPEDDLYTLFIDPDSAVLRGVRLTMRHPRRLAALGLDSQASGVKGDTHSFRRWTMAGGMRVPVEYRSRNEAGETDGFHVLERIEVDVDPATYGAGDPAPTDQASTGGAGAPAADIAASLSAEEIVERVSEAHGGRDAWSAAPAVRFDNYFFNPLADESGWQSPWWVAREAIDQESRAVRQDWPLLDARIGFDGETVWSESFGLGNPPSFMLYFFYYFLHLPFLAGEDVVLLGEPATGTLPGSEDEYVTVEVGFAESPVIGKSSGDGFRLYVDPKSFLLKGYEYWVRWPPLLQLFGIDEGGTFGPVLRIIDLYAEADGLVVPTIMHTMPGNGSRTIGHHLILSYDYGTPLDLELTARPAGAAVDTLAAVR